MVAGKCTESCAAPSRYARPVHFIGGRAEYHKSLKQNASAAKSPTRTAATQSTHLFCCLHAHVKLERIQAAATLNHSTIKERICHAGLKKMFSQLRSLPSASLNSLATA